MRKIEDINVFEETKHYLNNRFYLVGTRTTNMKH